VHVTHHSHLWITSSHLLLSAIIADREVRIREAWVKTMEVRIAREVLTECQKVEGVNHYGSCKELAARYVDLLHDAKASDVISFQLSFLLLSTLFPSAGEGL
jgi:hypothetical protein